MDFVWSARAASSRTLVSRRSAPRPIPTQGRAARVHADRTDRCARPVRRNLPLSRAIREAVHAVAPAVPVVGWGIGTFHEAEDALARGDCDIVAAARQSLADPDWWRKVFLGRGSAYRCLYTNYCEGLDQKHKEVTCQLWDRRALMTRSSPRRASAVRPPTTGRGGSSAADRSPEPRSGRSAAEHGGNRRGLAPWTERDPPDARGAGSTSCKEGDARPVRTARSSGEVRSALPPRRSLDRVGVDRRTAEAKDPEQPAGGARAHSLLSRSARGGKSRAPRGRPCDRAARTPHPLRRIGSGWNRRSRTAGGSPPGPSTNPSR